MEYPYGVPLKIIQKLKKSFIKVECPLNLHSFNEVKLSWPTGAGLVAASCHFEKKIIRWLQPRLENVLCQTSDVEEDR